MYAIEAGQVALLNPDTAMYNTSRRTLSEIKG
jgi:hypothetical protein